MNPAKQADLKQTGDRPRCAILSTSTPAPSVSESTKEVTRGIDDCKESLRALEGALDRHDGDLEVAMAIRVGSCFADLKHSLMAASRPAEARLVEQACCDLSDSFRKKQFWVLIEGAANNALKEVERRMTKV
jgi:hypothetical protein